jgi:hypothetical protein
MLAAVADVAIVSLLEFGFDLFFPEMAAGAPQDLLARLKAATFQPALGT